MAIEETAQALTQEMVTRAMAELMDPMVWMERRAEAEEQNWALTRLLGLDQPKENKMATEAEPQHETATGVGVGGGQEHPESSDDDD